MSKISPMQRTLKWLREQGAYPDIVESYNSFSRRRKDLYGIIDVLSLFPKKAGGYKLIAIQVCGVDWLPHIKKILDSPYSKKWLTTNSGLWLVGWRKIKSGWKPRIHKFSRGDWKNYVPQPLSASESLKILKLPKPPDVSNL